MTKICDDDDDDDDIWYRANNYRLMSNHSMPNNIVKIFSFFFVYIHSPDSSYLNEDERL